jgi:hypothetical protein
MQGVAVVVDPATETVVTILHVRGRRGARYRRQCSGRGRRSLRSPPPPPILNVCPFN